MNFKVKALLAVAAVSASSFALAQNKNFTGFSAGVNANFASSNAEYSGANVNPTLKSSKGDQNASLEGRYGIGINDKFVVGLGLTYAIGDLKAGTVNAGGNNVDSKIKGSYSIDVAPGYVVSASTLAYLKLSYAGGQSEASGPGVGATLSTNLTGTGIGLGFRTMLTNTLYLQGEYVMTSYNKSNLQVGTDVKADTSTAVIGIGYNF